MQTYGRVIPGAYLVDGYGNWADANNAMHRGNNYRDAQRGRGGSSRDGSCFSPRDITIRAAAAKAAAA